MFIKPVLAGCLILSPVQAQDVAVDLDLGDLLAQAVDLSTSEERRNAARELAQMEDVSVDQWLQAAASLLPLEGGAANPGDITLSVDLDVLGSSESTQLAIVVPESYDPAAPAPLLVALHGSGGDGASMLWAWRDVAAELGAILLAPTEAGPNDGFLGTSRERASVLAAIRWSRRRYNIDENRIWLTGYSRGGHLCWDLALRYPDLFAAAAPCAGGPRFALERGTNNIRFFENLRGLPLRAMLGALDSPGMIWNAQELIRRTRKAKVESAELLLIENLGHELEPQRLDDWASWFRSSVRDPLPSTVVRSSVRGDEVRRMWLEVGDFSSSVEEVFQPTLRVKRGESPDQEALRTSLISQAIKRTARVEAKLLEPGRLRFDSVGARSVRLLIPRQWIPAKGKLKVRDGNRQKTFEVEESAQVLLEEFVERFDRTFLPVAELTFKTKGK
ncbi:MAG: putative esterase [Planctomycetota bacterium]|jgi:predicted esterase